jgi:hypothetical protein
VSLEKELLELIVHVIELFSEKMFMSCEGVKLLIIF